MNLAKALECLKIPEKIKYFIINIYKDRSIKVITSLGLTEAFVVGDGIDQGEAISPLIWWIFYDPVLYRIQEDDRLGYEMSLDWPSSRMDRPIYN